MIPWIQVYSNLPQHRKTSRLADELGLISAALNPNVMAMGMVVSLWAWAVQNAYDGDLSGCSPRAVAEACMWRKKPETLVNALIKAGFLDADMRIHDWDEYSCLLIEQEEARRAKTRDRVRKHREKRMEGLFCAYCGDKATGFDHIVPVSKGGTDDDENLVPCCPECNREKNNRPLADFLNTSRKLRRELVGANERLMQHVIFENGRFVPHCVTLRNASTIPNHTYTVPVSNIANTKILLKEKEKVEKERESFCGETSSPPPIALPLNDGSMWSVSQEMVDEWSSLYPAVDVLQQLRNMRGWLDSNPSRRKTKSGIRRFITGWLSKEQDKGPRTPAQQPRGRMAFLEDAIRRDMHDGYRDQGYCLPACDVVAELQGAAD